MMTRVQAGEGSAERLWWERKRRRGGGGALGLGALGMPQRWRRGEADREAASGDEAEAEERGEREERKKGWRLGFGSL